MFEACAEFFSYLTASAMRRRWRKNTAGQQHRQMSDHVAAGYWFTHGPLLYTYIFDQVCTQLRRAPDLSGRYYYVSRGLSRVLNDKMVVSDELEVTSAIGASYFMTTCFSASKTNPLLFLNLQFEDMCMCIYIYRTCFYLITYRLGPPHWRGFTITLIYSTVGRTLDEWSGRPRDLYLTTQTFTTDIHAPGGIRTHFPSKWTAADPRLRPRGPDDCFKQCGQADNIHTRCV
jgi:hypothetical protein